jgi:MFS family permease
VRVNSENKKLLAASCFAAFITPFTGTMLNLSLVNIGDEFGVGSHNLAYINTIFLVASVVFMVPLAKISDIYGRKKVFKAGLAVYGLASLLGFFSPSFGFLLAMRVMMGLGTAAIAGTSITMLTDAFPADERGGAIGLNTSSVYLGTALGPVLGGIINDFLGWRSVLLIPVPLALLALFMISITGKDSSVLYGKRFDLAGTVLYSSAIIFSMLGLANLPNPTAAVFCVLGLFLLWIFVRYAKRMEEPILDVRIFSNSLFSRSCFASLLGNSANFAVAFFMALYLQTVGALTSSQAGLVMLTQTIVQVAFTAYFGRLHDRMNDKRILPTAGIGLTTMGVLLMMVIPVTMNLPLVVVTLGLFGMGNAVFNAPNTATIMSSVCPEDRAAASAMVAVMRQSGMMICMGIAMTSIALVMGSLDNLMPSTYSSFVDAIHLSFLISAFMCVAAMTVSWFRGRGYECTDDISV